MALRGTVSTTARGLSRRRPPTYMIHTTKHTRGVRRADMWYFFVLGCVVGLTFCSTSLMAASRDSRVPVTYTMLHTHNTPNHTSDNDPSSAAKPFSLG